jgi:hypothetical protein
MKVNLDERNKAEILMTTNSKKNYNMKDTVSFGYFAYTH